MFHFLTALILISSLNTGIFSCFVCQSVHMLVLNSANDVLLWSLEEYLVVLVQGVKPFVLSFDPYANYIACTLKTFGF